MLMVDADDVTPSSTAHRVNQFSVASHAAGTCTEHDKSRKLTTSTLSLSLRRDGPLLYGRYTTPEQP